MLLLLDPQFIIALLDPACRHSTGPSVRHSSLDPQILLRSPGPQFIIALLDPPVLLSQSHYTASLCWTPSWHSRSASFSARCLAHSPPGQQSSVSSSSRSVTRHLTSPAGCHRSRTFTTTLSHHTPYSSGSSQHSAHPSPAGRSLDIQDSLSQHHTCLSVRHHSAVSASTATAAAPAHWDPTPAIFSNRGRGSPHAGVSALLIRVLSKSNRRSHRKQ
jgi:hypothetical protein